MTIPDKHPFEQERLYGLRGLGILDTPREARFDDLTALAAAICEVPIALVSLVDEDRQWFKSRLGVEADETDLSRSVCAHAILGGDALVIEDTTIDLRTRGNPLNDEIGMRFYAGVPLIGAAGLPYGSLCVLDRVPRRLNADQLDALRRLARQAVAQLELGRHLREAETARGELARALERQDVLREEIDHRVKNSLTQVAALLRIEAAAADTAAGEVLARAQKRIETIAAVHRELNRAAGVQTVALDRFIANMAQDFRAMLPGNVALKTDMAHIEIGNRHAAHFAIILNEAVANAAKYAFGDGREGRIEVVGRLEGEVLRLTITDDGAGPGPNPPAPRALGHRIIEAAAQSLSSTPRRLDLAKGFGLTFDIPLATLRTLQDQPNLAM